MKFPRLLLVCLCLALGSIAKAEQPPNFIVILVDDLGWMDLSCQGSDYYKTPNIDRLATEGMRFTNGYAACAVCSPSRAALQTGRYPARVGVTDWIRAMFQRGGIGTPEANPRNMSLGPTTRWLFRQTPTGWSMRSSPLQKCWAMRDTSPPM